LANRLGGDFRWQHLPVPFEVYADGIDLVIFEEFGSGAAALHLQEEIARNELLRDEAYRRWFRKDYEAKWGPRVWHRDFFDAEIVACPDASVVGKSFGQVGVERGGLHPVDAFLDLVVEHGTAIRWRTTISNHRPELLRKLAVDPGLQIGFSDAGAHLRNMAFYNSGLRLLRHVQDAAKAGRPFMTLEDYHEAPVPQFGNLSRMVNRNDDAVSAVFVGGRLVWSDGAPTATLGRERTGRFLRSGQRQREPLGTSPASASRAG
jgi:N-acyl-D-aspartate/D-glutamate deacylase